MNKDKHLYNFDILKITAALLIVCHHYQMNASASLGRLNFAYGKFPFGTLVELFFIISGFLTEYTYKENIPFKERIARRLLRIYPYTTAACAVFLAAAGVYGALFGEPLFNIVYSAKVIITSFLLVHQGWLWALPSAALNNPTWYLCVLLLCYLIYFAVRKLVPESVCKKPLIYMALSVFGGVGFLVVIPVPFLTLPNARGYAGFFLGCFLCCAAKNADRKKAVRVSAALLVFSVVILVLTTQKTANWTVLTYLFYPSLALTAFFLPQLRSGAVKTAGAVSFQIYIWHSPIYGIFMTVVRCFGIAVHHSYFTLFVFALAVSAFSTAMYYAFEKPLSAYIRKRFGGG